MKVAARWLVAACFAVTAMPALAQLPISNGLREATAFDDAYGSGRFIEGGYQIAARQGLTRWFWYNGFIPSSVRFEVTTTLRGGPNGEGYGIAFARPSRETAQWCTFMIDADGHYKLVKWGGDDAIPWRESARINTGIGGRNVIAIEVQGRSVVLFINGTQVDTWYADRDVAGNMGLEVSQGVEVRFENFTAYAPGAALPVAAGGGKGGGMAVVAPSAVSSAGGALLWSDDFSTFTVADDAMARSEYREGGLLVNSRQGMTRWLFYRGLAQSNVRISVSAQFRGGPSNAKFGVAFGRPSRDEARWMAFDVTADGQYYLEGYGATNNMGPAPSPAVMRGYSSTNRISVEVRGSQVMMYVNGQFVASYTATREASGYVGIHVSPGAQVLFSNLRVETLN